MEGNMNINISGQQIDIGQSLQARVQEELQENMTKYFDRSTHAYVHFSREAFLFKCDISLNKGAGDSKIVNARAVSKDIYQAFELAMSHLKKQLLKYKDKLKHHHKDKEELHNSFMIATKYIFSPNDNKLIEEDNPVIIAEKATQISNLNVSEAVMRMNLLGLPALMFRNRVNGKMNVVYYREDGNISWIDPKEE
jgi:ribosomal subunit interface protein